MSDERQNEYRRAVDEARVQHPRRTLVRILCVACRDSDTFRREQTVATITERPRGPFYDSQRQSTEVLGFELQRRRLARGENVDDRWKPLLRLAGPRDERVPPARERVSALLGFPGIPDAELPAWCDRHGEWTIDSRLLWELVRMSRTQRRTVELPLLVALRTLGLPQQ